MDSLAVCGLGGNNIVVSLEGMIHMRGAESLVLAGLVALIGVGFWQGKNLWPTLESQARSLVGARPIARVVPVKEAKPDQKAIRRARSKAGKGANAPSTPDSVNPENLIVVDVPPPADPTPQSLTPGTTRSALQQQYGTPSLDVTARQGGQLVERYYYFSKNAGQVTVATLRDGKVVSAEAVPY